MCKITMMITFRKRMNLKGSTMLQIHIMTVMIWFSLLLETCSPILDPLSAKAIQTQNQIQVHLLSKLQMSLQIKNSKKLMSLKKYR